MPVSELSARISKALCKTQRSACKPLDGIPLVRVVLCCPSNRFRAFLFFVFNFDDSWDLTVAINPNGRNYASGAEDGYVRLHFFDKSYLDMKDPVPEAEESTDDDEDNANAE